MDIAVSQVGHPLIVNLQVSSKLAKRAVELLSNRRVTQCDENFVISTETIDHADMDAYCDALNEQYQNADDNTKYFLKRVKLVKQGDQFASAISTGVRNQYSVSIIATSRKRNGTTDEHKILIATMKRSMEMSAAWTFFATLFGIKTAEQKELESILKQLSAEDGKKCIEAFAVQALGDRIRSFLGDSVEVRFVEN